MLENKTFRTCECGNTKQSDFSPYRGNTCRLCLNKKAAEYRRKNADKYEANRRASYQKKRERLKTLTPDPVDPPDESTKLFKELLTKARFSGRYTSGQLDKTRKSG